MNRPDNARAGVNSLVADRNFEPVATTLREEVLAHCERNAVELEGRAGWNTLETNSGFAERRAAPLVAMAVERLDAASLRGLRVADIGCGFGALSAYFAYCGASVTGIDVNAGRLDVGSRVAERHGLELELKPGSMLDPGLERDSFDVVVMNNSLCYLAEPAKQLRALVEARRLLVPGGVIALRNPNRLHPVDQFTGIPLLGLLPPARTVRLAARLGRRRSLCRLVSPRTARRELLEAGFGAVKLHPNGPARAMRPVAFARYSHLTALRPETGKGR